MELLIVSGHSSGLGRALFEAAQGSDRVVLGISRRSLGSSGARVAEISLDLASPAPWEESLDRICQKWQAPWRRVVLINNAGSALPVGPTATLEPAAIIAAMQLNVVAPLRLFRWILQKFPETPQRLVAISSGAATKAYPSWAVYCSSKAALRMQAQVIAAEMELLQRDVKVLAYEPGVIATPMQEQIRQIPAQDFPASTRFRDLHERGELIDPRDAAQALLQLLAEPQTAYFKEHRYAHVTEVKK